MLHVLLCSRCMRAVTCEFIIYILILMHTYCMCTYFSSRTSACVRTLISSGSQSLREADQTALHTLIIQWRKISPAVSPTHSLPWPVASGGFCRQTTPAINHTALAAWSATSTAWIIITNCSHLWKMKLPFKGGLVVFKRTECEHECVWKRKGKVQIWVLVHMEQLLNGHSWTFW